MNRRSLAAVLLALGGTVAVGVLTLSGVFDRAGGPKPGGPIAEVFEVNMSGTGGPPWMPW